MRSLILGVLLSMVACKSKNSIELSNADKNSIAKIIDDYQDGWLTGDSSRLLSLFADSAILIPSGMRPIKGKENIIKFWWPNDSSKTTINRYDIDIVEIHGEGNLAYVLENGQLSWSYEKGDFKMSKDQESYEITVLAKNNGKWKIVRRIWEDLKAGRTEP